MVEQQPAGLIISVTGAYGGGGGLSGTAMGAAAGGGAAAPGRPWDAGGAAGAAHAGAGAGGGGGTARKRFATPYHNGFRHRVLLRGLRLKVRPTVARAERGEGERGRRGGGAKGGRA